MGLKFILFMFFFTQCVSFRPFPKKQFLSLSIVKNIIITKTRNVFIERANKAGVPWETMTNYYKNRFPDLQQRKRELENSYIYYPPYYKKAFHGYNRGNLNWLAALEAKAASLTIAVNYWKNIDPFTSECWLRNNFTKSVVEYINNNEYNLPINILDMGCSTGISTEYLKIEFPYANFTGMDLSPYFLSVASFQNEMLGNSVNLIHGNVENTHLPHESMDLISLQFILHEVPMQNIHNILKESYRILSPNGTIAILDFNTKTLENKLQQNPLKLWAFELTEPHMEEYYETNITEFLASIGFKNIIQKNNDPMNSIWIGSKL